MKKIYILTSLFFLCSLYATAQMQNQDSIFMANVWRLQKLEINQNIIPAPNNNELSFPKLLPNKHNNEYYFLKEHCSPGEGQAFFEFNGSSTFFIKNYVVTSWLCKNSTNEQFITQLYDNNFIWDNVNSNFQYIITAHTTYLELVITGQNGNKAYYHNNLSASLEDIIRNNVKVYPNPISDVFYIEGDTTILDDINEINIYDLSGKLVFKNKIEIDKPIDVSQLSSGSYLLNFVYKNQLIKYGIIIKK